MPVGAGKGEQEKGTQLIIGSRRAGKGDAAHYWQSFHRWYHARMPRRPRICPAGLYFHILNHTVARLTLFKKPEDYKTFERVLHEAVARIPLPIFSYILMSAQGVPPSSKALFD